MKKEKNVNVYKELLKSRTLWVHGEVNDKMSKKFITQALFLYNQSKEPITILIDSVGGSCSSGLSMYSTIRAMSKKCEIHVKVIGLASSMGSILAMCAPKVENRKILKTAQFLIHSPRISGTIKSSVSDLKVSADSIAKTKKVLYEILSEGTGKTVDFIENAAQRDLWLDAKESVEWGLVGSIIEEL